MNSTASLAVAETIKFQIGSAALCMLGAKNLLADEKSLTFKIQGSPKGVTHIRVTLTPMDTYTLEFLRCVGTRPVVELSRADDVYNDSLLTCIEMRAGLRTSL